MPEQRPTHRQLAENTVLLVDFGLLEVHQAALVKRTSLLGLASLRLDLLRTAEQSIP